MFSKGMARNRPFNIRLFLANDGFAPWSVSHIGFSHQGVLETLSHEDNRESTQAVLGRLQRDRQLDGDSHQNDLSPLETSKLLNRMNIVKSIRNNTAPVRKFLRYLKKEWCQRISNRSVDREVADKREQKDPQPRRIAGEKHNLPVLKGDTDSGVRTHNNSSYEGDENSSKTVPSSRKHPVLDDEKERSSPNLSNRVRVGLWELVMLKEATGRRLLGEYLCRDTIVRKVRHPKSKKMHDLFVDRD